MLQRPAWCRGTASYELGLFRTVPISLQTPWWRYNISLPPRCVGVVFASKSARKSVRDRAQGRGPATLRSALPREKTNSHIHLGNMRLRQFVISLGNPLAGLALANYGVQCQRVNSLSHLVSATRVVAFKSISSSVHMPGTG